MAKFYFTYGISGYPFYGGWTLITAPTIHDACTIFRMFHPDKTEGLLNCASVYTEEEFLKTEMAGDDGNFSQYCHEEITLTVKPERS